MSAELDSVLEVLKTMFTELADDLSDLRGEALAAKILAGHALDAVITAAPNPEQTLNDLKKRTLQARFSRADRRSQRLRFQRYRDRVRD